jgi:hypothetical protein
MLRKMEASKSKNYVKSVQVQGFQEIFSKSDAELASYINR